MDFLRRYRVALVLCLLLVGLGGAVWYWTRARTASAVTRGRPDPVVGVVSPQRRDIEANLENQRAMLAKARAVAANDGRQSDRMKTLFEKGMVSAVDWDNARTNADSSRASTDSAEAQLRLAEVQITTQESQVRLAQAQVETFRAALSLAASNLSNTRLLAPFAG